ncbi:MAG: ABC transporter ATP-binding protein [Clostridia bacterium]|nr:ABC transporter ATP-binding protein [Clostridia bacterium]
MLVIDNLRKKYLSTDIYAVDGLSLELKEGEIFGFLGQNGAGKSTTIKCITGIYPFECGEITICGHSIKKESIAAKLNIGYVPDNHSVYEKLTGREYVNYIADLYDVTLEKREERLNKYLKIFKLETAVDRQIKGYSHGMKQKICIIAALIHEPKLWILDEPMVGLDPQSIFEIIENMKQHCAKGNTVFFSSHNIDLVAKLCNRAAIIDGGKLCEVIDLNVNNNREKLETIFRSYTMAEGN